VKEKDNVKEKVKENVKDNVKEKENVKENVKEKVKENVKDNVKENVKENVKVKENFNDNVKEKDNVKEVKDNVKEKVKDKDNMKEKKVKDNVKENVKEKENVKAKEKDNVKEKVKDKVKEKKVKENVKEKVKDASQPWGFSYLQPLDGGKECEGQREEGPRAELPQLAARHAAPVDGPGITHLQLQVHGSFTTTTTITAGHRGAGRQTASLCDRRFSVPAVGDLTDDIKRFLQVHRVGDRLQRQPDVSVPRSLEDRR